MYLIFDIRQTIFPFCAPVSAVGTQQKYVSDGLSWILFFLKKKKLSLNLQIISFLRSIRYLNGEVRGSKDCRSSGSFESWILDATLIQPPRASSKSNSQFQKIPSSFSSESFRNFGLRGTHDPPFPSRSMRFTRRFGVPRWIFDFRIIGGSGSKSA